MSIATGQRADIRVVTKERLEGNAQRWRRFGEPVPAGESLRQDGTPDYGLFGPGSMVWQVLLHPATIVFQFAFQGTLQSTYRPIVAGVRDWDPMSRKARKGELTFFDLFERGQRNSGMHAPMWLADTPSAELMAKHLHNIHGKVAGDVIDVAEPELGGYNAAGPRDAMWAALTEMHSMLWLYENLAYRNGKRPHRLSDADRDQYFAEAAAYCRLVGSNEAEIPHNKADLDALYGTYDVMFGVPESGNYWPDGSGRFDKAMFSNMKKNFHRSQIPAIIYAVVLDHGLFKKMALGAGPERQRKSVGMDAKASKKAVRKFTRLRPLAWLFQRGAFERHYMRLMWGPDGVKLIENARRLEAEHGFGGPRNLTNSRPA